MSHEGDGTDDKRNLPYTPAAMQAALRAGAARSGGPAQQAPNDLAGIISSAFAGMNPADVLSRVLGPDPNQMTPYQAAQIAAELSSQQIQREKMGQSAASDAASNSVAAAAQAATQAWYEAQAANQRGDLELARRKQDEANYWNRVSQEFSAQSAAREEAGLANDAFKSLESSRGARAGEQLGAGGLYGDLAKTVGNLAVEQQRLGLDILTRPRNAVAGFLMGLGNNEAAKSFGNFDIKSILGIDPNSIQGFLQQAVGAAQAAQAQARAPQQIDLPKFLAGIDAAAKRISAGAGGGMQQPQFPGAPAAAAPAPTPGAGSTAPDFQRQPPGVMTIPGPTLASVLPGMMDQAQPAPYFPFDAAAGYSDGSGMAGGAPVPYTGPTGAPPPAVPSMTVPGMYPGSYPPDQQMPGNSFVGQLDALLSGGQPAQSYYGGPQGTPADQELWGNALRDLLMQQFQGQGQYQGSPSPWE